MVFDDLSRSLAHLSIQVAFCTFGFKTMADFDFDDFPGFESDDLPLADLLSDSACESDDNN